LVKNTNKGDEKNTNQGDEKNTNKGDANTDECCADSA
jgi:hypothetical protein